MLPPMPPPTDPLAPTIFHEPWWLDIAAGGNYGMAEVADNGQIVGRLPYFLRSRFGLAYSIPPPLTHFLGPAVAEGDGSAHTRFLRRLQITRSLIRQLPPAALYKYKCHRDIAEVVAFQQERFSTAVQFTHEVYPDMEAVIWRNMRSQKRRKIRRASEILTLADLHDPQEFWRFYDNNLRQRGKVNDCGQEMVCRLIEACLLRHCGRIYAAWDKSAALVAAVFCVWDNRSAYYFMTTRRPDAHNGAISAVTWEAMKDAARRGLIFDFDGLNNASSVQFYAEFGGIVCPRLIVTRGSWLGRLGMGLKDLPREGRFFN